MEGNNKIRGGFIIVTENSTNKPYNVAINPNKIVAIDSVSGWGGCYATIHVEGRESCLETRETFDEIMQLIEEYNKQRKANSNYD